MNRGEVWLINFNPSLGGEIQKVRPGIIISNDISNKYLNRVQAVPLSGKIHKLYPSECLVELNQQKSKAMADQLMTVSKKRFIKFLGKVSDRDLAHVEKIIRIQLDLNTG